MPDLSIIEARPRRSRFRSEAWRRAAIVSGVIHLLVLAFLLFGPKPRVPPPPPAESAVSMVFSGGQQQQATAPNPTQRVEIPKGENAVTPRASQSESAPSSSEPAPPPAEVNPIPPEFAAPEPIPEPRETQPQPSHSTGAQSAPQREARRAPPSRSASRNNPFAHPMQFSLGPATREAPRGLRTSRGLNLDVGPVIKGGVLQDAVAHISSPGAAGDYIAALSDYVESHKFYPEQAAANGEDGESIIRVTIKRDGTVTNVQLLASAGSGWLDSAWESLFRSHKLPPFPDDMPEKERTFTLSMDYILERR